MLSLIWEKKYPFLLAISRGILRDASAAEDALQEAFIKALRRRPDLSIEHSAVKYLQRVVISTSIDIYRRQARRREELPLPAEDRGRDPDTHRVRESAAPGPDPETILQRKERRNREREILFEVGRALRRLPVEQRAAIERVFHHNGTLQEHAMELGIPYSTLRSRVQIGIDKIRKQLRRRGLLPAREIRP